MWTYISLPCLIALQFDNLCLSTGGVTGQFLGEIGRHVEAAEHYARASALAPADFELVFNTANAMRQAGACVTRYHHVTLNFSKQK